jgi:hypothetical protein
VSRPYEPVVGSGTSFSRSSFDSAAAAMTPGGDTPLADALLDIKNTMVTPSFGGLPAGEPRYLAMLTDGLLTSGSPMSSIPNGSFTPVAVFSMGFGTGLDVDYPTLQSMVDKGQTLRHSTGVSRRYRRHHRQILFERTGRGDRLHQHFRRYCPVNCRRMRSDCSCGILPLMSTSASLYHRHRFPAEIISHCVWLYFRFALSFRDVEEMLAMRGVSLSYETVRKWCLKFGQTHANGLRHKSPRPGDHVGRGDLRRGDC